MNFTVKVFFFQIEMKEKYFDLNKGKLTKMVLIL